MHSLPPKMRAGDGPCCRQLMFSSSVHQEQLSQGDQAQGTSCCPKTQAICFQERSLDGPGVPLQEHALECRFQKGVFPVQFSFFSLSGIRQHPVALKPEVKGQKNGEYVCSAQSFMLYARPTSFLFIAALQKRDFSSIVCC